MTSLVLDPFIFACPLAGASSADVLNYFKALADLRDMSFGNYAVILSTSYTQEILQQAEVYPPYPVVKSFIEQHKIDFIDAHDVSGIMVSILGRSNSLEDSVEFTDAVNSSFSVQPSGVYTERPTLFHPHLERLYTLIAAYCNGVSRDTVLLSYPLSSDPLDVDIDVSVGYWDYYGDQVISLPVAMNCSVIASITINEILRRLDSVGLWLTAKTPSELNNAIQLRSLQMQLAISGSFDENKLRKWTIGRAFIENARECGAFTIKSRAEALLRACAETITSTNLADTHPLRTNSGGGSPQQTRGTDKAWRRDVDYEYHLHYWEADSGPEFANLGPHNSYKIKS